MSIEPMDDWLALLFGLVFVAVGLFALRFLKARQIEATSPFITIILLGAAIFLVLSGRLQSFKLGDFEATIAAVASTPVAISEVVVSEVAVSAEMAKVRSSIEAAFNQPRPVVLLRVTDWDFPLTELSKLDVPAFYLGLELQGALLNGSLRAVIVIDGRDRPVGVFEPSFFFDLMRIRFEGVVPHEDKLQRLKETGLWQLLLNPGVNGERLGNPAWIPTGTSNLVALERMRENDWDVLAIHDRNLAVSGIATRSGIQEALTIDLLKPASK